MAETTRDRSLSLTSEDRGLEGEGREGVEGQKPQSTPRGHRERKKQGVGGGGGGVKRKEGKGGEGTVNEK